MTFFPAHSPCFPSLSLLFLLLSFPVLSRPHPSLHLLPLSPPFCPRIAQAQNSFLPFHLSASLLSDADNRKKIADSKKLFFRSLCYRFSFILFTANLTSKSFLASHFKLPNSGSENRPPIPPSAHVLVFRPTIRLGVPGTMTTALFERS